MDSYANTGPVEPIPLEWKKAVIQILKTGTTNREILWRPNAVSTWMVYGYQMDVYPAMLATLEQEGCLGRRWFQVEKQERGGEAYAFMFRYKGYSYGFYGKIHLHDGKVKIKVVSAHKAEKEEL